jgi:hypothetical protein
MRKFALGAVAALGLAGAAPAVAQAPTVNLSISRVSGGPQGSTTTVQYAELVRISGEITNGQPNQPVELTVAPYRGDTRVVSLRTDSTGDLSACASQCRRRRATSARPARSFKVVR